MKTTHGMSQIDTEYKNSTSWPVSIDTKQATIDHLLPTFEQLLDEEGLTGEAHFVDQFESLYLPMAAWLASRQSGQPLVVGIHGAQGSGKSTLTKILRALLTEGFGKRVVAISIDDLYLTRDERQRLSDKVHPLLMTRGVPGTHDTLLASIILNRLKSAEGGCVSIPVFDKAMDDRADESQWQQVECPVDIVLFEGWCVGAMPQNPDDLDDAINLLEASEDNNKQWRYYVNKQLNGEYKELFSVIDILMMLKVPSMESVFEWRSLQETKLRQSVIDKPDAAKHVMSGDELKRFIQHYERITRQCLNEMPERADVLMSINQHHQIDSVSIKET